MLGNLGENLTNTMKKLVGMSVIDKKTIKEVVKDIQRALIQSDVNIKLVLDLSKKIEERALEEEPPKGITPREHVITIIYEEMVNLLGSEAAGLDINDRPYKILFLGLQGSGKTTTIGKLCRYLQKRGFNPAVVCTDTWRPAAYEQLRQLTEEMDVPLYGDPNNKDALDLAQKGLQEFKNRKVIIFDTAGRHKDEADLIAEMNELDNIINPNEAILVIDGTIGQQAGEQAKAFEERLGKFSETVGEKYADLPGASVLLAVGDGNHSLATAKSCYEALKAANPDKDLSNHPARYSLVELENIHDPSLVFAPIHRILTGVDGEKLLRDLSAVCAEEGYAVQWVMGKQRGTVYLSREKGELAVAVLQEFLDTWLKENAGEIDYIHGDEEVCQLAQQENAVGFLLPAMEKHQLFRGVISGGALPRKTFSMGHAREKRYYLEGRKIK